MQLPGSLQENILTLLAYDDNAGRIVSGLVDASLFEGDYAEIARECLAYWSTYRTAPKDHTADLFAAILEDPNNRRGRVFRNVLHAMYEMAQSINTKYVLDQLSYFVRVQTLKSAILRSAEKIQQTGANVTEIENLWHDVLRSQVTTIEQGSTLADFENVVNNMTTLKSEFTFGIPLLDEMTFVPYRRSTTMLVGPTGRGKSWFMVHVGKHNLLLGKKVLHISLEMSETQVLERYYQSLFAVSKREARLRVPVFSYEEDYGYDVPRHKRLVDDIFYETVKPAFTLSSPIVADELHVHVGKLHGRATNLRVRSYPSKTLTVPMLEAYLDTLETVFNFVPDILLVDYVGIMKISANNYRIDLGQNFVGLRAIADRRNIALVTAQQANKQAAASGKARLTDVSEDWSLASTSDQAMSLSSTRAELDRGLARLFIDKARSERDKYEILITQNFGIGQFALDAVMMRSRYKKLIRGQDSEDED